MTNDAVDLKGVLGKEKGLRDDDCYTDGKMCNTMSDQENGDEEIDAATEIRDRPSFCIALAKCIAMAVLLYGPLFGVIFALGIPNAALSRLVIALCGSCSLGTFAFMIYGIITKYRNKCRNNPEYRARLISGLRLAGFLIGSLLAMVVSFFGSCGINIAFVFFAFGMDSVSVWATSVLLVLQVVVCFYAKHIGEISYQRFSLDSIDVSSAGAVCQMWKGFFALCLLMIGLTGMMIGLAAFIAWVILDSPRPAIDWIPPVVIVPTFFCCISFLRDSLVGRSTTRYSVASQLELANSPLEKDGPAASKMDGLDDDKTDTETTISGEVV